MKTSNNGLEFISKWEGCILKPYKDIAGLRTIGIGHLIKPDENFPDGVEITKEKALELLAADVKICENAIIKHIKVPLNQNQFDSLVSFGFNCGTGVYSTSEACKTLNKGNYNEVPEKLLSWCKVRINGALTVSKGLQNRRIAEGQLFSSTLAQETEPVISWSSDRLKEAQQKLKLLGLYLKSVDGVWGPGTELAITSFAVEKGIDVGENLSKEIPTKLFEAIKNS
jgi:lysozyme